MFQNLLNLFTMENSFGEILKPMCAKKVQPGNSVKKNLLKNSEIKY